MHSCPQHSGRVKDATSGKASTRAIKQLCRVEPCGSGQTTATKSTQQQGWSLRSSVRGSRCHTNTGTGAGLPGPQRDGKPATSWARYKGGLIAPMRTTCLHHSRSSPPPRRDTCSRLQALASSGAASPSQTSYVCTTMLTRPCCHKLATQQARHSRKVAKRRTCTYMQHGATGNGDKRQ